MGNNEKSPFEGRRMSINKIGEVMEELLVYDRNIWLKMCKGSKVILKEGNVVMGPHPNWKAYEILCHILAYEQENVKKVADAKAAIKGRPLFITPGVAVVPNVFTPPV